jgi:hypothetical protein
VPGQNSVTIGRYASAHESDIPITIRADEIHLFCEDSLHRSVVGGTSLRRAVGVYSTGASLNFSHIGHTIKESGDWLVCWDNYH